MITRRGGLLGVALGDPEALRSSAIRRAAEEALEFFPEFKDAEEALAFFGAIPEGRLGQLWVPESAAIN